MLVLSRQRDESIIIGDNIVVTIVDIRGDKVRWASTLPPRSRFIDRKSTRPSSARTGVPARFSRVTPAAWAPRRRSRSVHNRDTKRRSIAPIAPRRLVWRSADIAPPTEPISLPTWAEPFLARASSAARSRSLNAACLRDRGRAFHRRAGPRTSHRRNGLRLDVAFSVTSCATFAEKAPRVGS